MRTCVAIGDLHADATTAGVDRFAEIERAAMYAVELANARKADLFAFLGDLADPESLGSHRASALAIRMMAAAHMTSIWIGGNHDVIEDGTGATTLSALAAAAEMSGAWDEVCEEPAYLSIPTWDERRIRVLALPYVARDRAYDPVAFVEGVNAPEGVDLVLGHLMIEGAQLGSETTDMARGRDVQLPIAAIRKRWPNAKILNGHYHRAQQVNGVWIPGSLARLARGEIDNTPSVLVLNLEDR